MEHSDTEDAESLLLKSSQSPVMGQGPGRSIFQAGVYNRHRRLRSKILRFILFLSLTSLSWMTINFYSGSWTYSSTMVEENWNRIRIINNKPLKNSSNNGSRLACPLPKLDPFGPKMMEIIDLRKFGKDPNCSNDSILGIYHGAAFHVEKGHILVRDLEFPGDVNCSFKDATKVKSKDDALRPLQIDLAANRTAIQPPTEVVMVTCVNSSGQLYYKDAFQIVQEKPEVERRIKKWEDGQLKLNLRSRLSVLIIGMETTSQMQFERALPRSKKFLDETLKAVRVMGYNKVGDNTISNWIPLFTGMSFDEFPKSCVEQRNNRVLPASECPFIWNTFASQGYRTSWSEDDRRLAGFEIIYNNAFEAKPPTDYYWRPFYVTMWSTLGFEGHCFGPRMAVECLTDMVKSMADVFNGNNANRHRPYFSFVWSGKLTHDDLNHHQWADKPLLEVLQYLHGNGHLNHTAVFLLGDHGWRNRDDIEQSMIENRMPLAYIVLPPWFPQRYSRAFQNLRWNAENSITSHYDMHKTILDILDMDRFDGAKWRENRHFRPIKPEMSWRGQSLFEMSAKERNCESAGIPWMWCLCMKKIPLRNDSFLAVDSAQAAIDAVNRKLEGEKHSALCETLGVGHMLNATLLILDDVASPECRLIIDNANATATPTTKKLLNSSFSSCKDEILVQISFVGTPNDPVYTTVVVFHPANGNFSAPYELKREDWYSTKGHCIRNSLRPYCICKLSRSDVTMVTVKILAVLILIIIFILGTQICSLWKKL